jgi:hypothetical protein
MLEERAGQQLRVLTMWNMERRHQHTKSRYTQHVETTGGGMTLILV